MRQKNDTKSRGFGVDEELRVAGKRDPWERASR
jgi:hypothetical protein